MTRLMKAVAEDRINDWVAIGFYVAAYAVGTSKDFEERPDLVDWAESEGLSDVGVSQRLEKLEAVRLVERRPGTVTFWADGMDPVLWAYDPLRLVRGA